MPEINVAGLTLIEQFESLQLTAYPDPGTGGAPWTIGYGHTGPDVHEGETITKTQAIALLEGDVAQAEHEVATLIQVVLTPNQFAALVSFQFNTGALGSSPAIALINDSPPAHFQEAWEDHLCLYVHGGDGGVLEGLVRRRAAEYALWKTP
jgi:lysozyme